MLLHPTGEKLSSVIFLIYVETWQSLQTVFLERIFCILRRSRERKEKSKWERNQVPRLVFLYNNMKSCLPPPPPPSKVWWHEQRLFFSDCHILKNKRKDGVLHWKEKLEPFDGPLLNRSANKWLRCQKRKYEKRVRFNSSGSTLVHSLKNHPNETSLSCWASDINSVHFLVLRFESQCQDSWHSTYPKGDSDRAKDFWISLLSRWPTVPLWSAYGHKRGRVDF